MDTNCVEVNPQILLQILSGSKIHLMLIGDWVNHLDSILMNEMSFERIMDINGPHSPNHIRGTRLVSILMKVSITYGVGKSVLA